MVGWWLVRGQMVVVVAAACGGHEDPGGGEQNLGGGGQFGGTGGNRSLGGGGGHVAGGGQPVAGGGHVAVGGQLVAGGGNQNTGGTADLPPPLCGNGIVEHPETCDDANDVEGDGCSACRMRGDRLWSAPSTCIGPVEPGNESSILVVCPINPESTYRRFSADGKSMAGPTAPIDAEEASNQPSRLAELADGSVFLATVLNRNLTTANQPRVRMYDLDAAGAPRWSLDITTFPQGPSEWANAVAGTPDWIAIAGLSVGPSDNRALIALFSKNGSLSWRKEVDGAQAEEVAVADDGTVFATGGTGYNIDNASSRTAAVWALTPSGGLAWSWQGPTAWLATVRDIRLTPDSIRVLVQAVTSDDLVPMPPRFVSSWTVVTLDRATGSVLETQPTFSETLNGTTRWNGALRYARFSYDEGFDSYYYGKDGVSVYSADGRPAWTATMPFLAASGTTIAIAGLLCQNDPHSTFEGFAPELTCYLAK